MTTGQTIKWDPDKEEIIGNPRAITTAEPSLSSTMDITNRLIRAKYEKQIYISYNVAGLINRSFSLQK